MTLLQIVGVIAISIIVTIEIILFALEILDRRRERRERDAFRRDVERSMRDEVTRAS